MILESLHETKPQKYPQNKTHTLTKEPRTFGKQHLLDEE